jgi:hypothetical protein
MCLSILFSCSKTDVVPEETGDIFKIDNVAFTLESASFVNTTSTSCTGKTIGTFYADTKSSNGVVAKIIVSNLASFEGDVSLERTSFSNCNPQSFIVLESSKGSAYMYPVKGTIISISKSKGTFSMQNAKFEDSGTTFTVSIAGKTK